MFDFGAHKFGFGLQNSTFVLKFGELEVEGDALGKARSEAFIYGFDLAGETITSYDDLFVELIKAIKNIKEFLLRLFLIDDKLEVVDNEAV